MIASWRRWRLRRRCSAIAASLPVPDPFDVHALCATIARQRGRAIHLMPASLSGGRLSGMWVSTERADYIVFEQATSRVHQEHIILHELGHLLCRHEGIAAAGTPRPRSRWSRWFRWSPRLAGRKPADADGAAKCRRYSLVEEMEAELVASLLRSGAGPRPAGPRASRPGGVAGAIERLENTLVHGR